MSHTEDQYDAHSKAILSALRSYIDEEFGEPCSSFNDGCPTCTMWGLFALFKQTVGIHEDGDPKTRSEFIQTLAEHAMARDNRKGPDVSAEALEKENNT
jgi:hypothetical protein